MPHWGLILQELADFRQANPDRAGLAHDVVRRKYLDQLFQYTNRNVIAYYSGWLQKPETRGVDINDEDKGGFMMAVHQLDRKAGLDLILHTPGGSIAATESLVNYLRRMFGHDIRAIVPQIAMSAGTILACSCKSILMGTHSNIGPIDPHLRDIPAYGVIDEFRRAVREVGQDASKIPLWQVIIGQYRPTFLSQCENAIRWTNSFVRDQLEEVMFNGQPDAAAKARDIVRKLSQYRSNYSHSRHIHLEECKALGLEVEELEADQQLQDLVLTVHHCFMHTMANTGAFKIIENHMGIAFVKQQQLITQALPIRIQPMQPGVPIPAPPDQSP